MKTKKQFLTTKEVAEELDLSLSTIYKYIKDNKLNPVYEDSWQIDETHLFRPEEVEAIKASFVKPGLTTGEVAKRLEVHPTTVSSYINQGSLKADKQFYRGRDIYFVTEDDLAAFKDGNNHLATRDKKTFYASEINLYLYQSVIHQESNRLARIIELDGEQGKVLTEEGETFPVTDLKARGFYPRINFKERDHITRRGYAKFKFNQSQYVNAPVFNLIEIFYQQVGYKNILLTETEEYIYLDVKPVLLQVESLDNNPFEIQMLKDSIIEGAVSNRHNGVLVESNLEPLNVFVSSDLKQSILDLADKEGATLSDYVSDVLQREIDRQDTEER